MSTNITQEQIEQNKAASKARRDEQKAAAKAAREQFVSSYRSTADAKEAALGRAQHYHDMNQNRTFAVVPPNMDALKTAAAKLIGGGKEVGVIVNVGISNVNTSTDNYERKIGRAVASSKLEPVLMRLDVVEVCDGFAKYELSLGKMEIILISQDESKELPMLVYARNDR